MRNFGFFNSEYFIPLSNLVVFVFKLNQTVVSTTQHTADMKMELPGRQMSTYSATLFDAVGQQRVRSRVLYMPAINPDHLLCKPVFTDKCGASFIHSTMHWKMIHPLCSCMAA